MADKMFSKVVISGDVIEVYKYEGPVFYNFKKPQKKDKKEEIKVDGETGEIINKEKHEQKKQEILDELPDNVKYLFERKKEYRKAAVYRARTTLRRRILANFDHDSKFVTLTFADGSIPDVTDIKLANREFKKFVQRLNRHLIKYDKPALKYATVVEFQKRGAVHYHMICNLPWIPHDELTRIWRNGWIGINSLKAKMREDGKDVDNVGAYMIKYMIKDFNDSRLKGQKMFFTSKGLKKSIELKGSEAEAFLWLNQFDQKKEVFVSEYESQYHGTIQYKEFNLKRSGATLNFTKHLPKAQ